MQTNRPTTAGMMLAQALMFGSSSMDRMLRLFDSSRPRRIRPDTKGIKEMPQVGARQIARYKRQGLHMVTINGKQIMQQAKAGEAYYAEQDGQSVEAYRDMKNFRRYAGSVGTRSNPL